MPIQTFGRTIPAITLTEIRGEFLKNPSSGL